MRRVCLCTFQHYLSSFMIATDNTNPHSETLPHLLECTEHGQGKESFWEYVHSDQHSSCIIMIMCVWIEQIGERERTWQCLWVWGWVWWPHFPTVSSSPDTSGPGSAGLERLSLPENTQQHREEVLCGHKVVLHYTLMSSWMQEWKMAEADGRPIYCLISALGHSMGNKPSISAHVTVYERIEIWY